MSFSKRDATTYFDSLVAPACVQPWFGRPALRLSELLAVLDPSSTINLRDFIDSCDEKRLDESLRLHPNSCVWPTGFSYSSAVGQEVMLAQSHATGLSGTNLLADDKRAPNPDVVNEFHAVCTDDFMYWSRCPQVAQSRLADLDAQWLRSGLYRRPEKDTN